jgi:hypothetical protein
MVPPELEGAPLADHVDEVDRSACVRDLVRDLRVTDRRVPRLSDPHRPILTKIAQSSSQTGRPAGPERGESIPHAVGGSKEAGLLGPFSDRGFQITLVRIVGSRG